MKYYKYIFLIIVVSTSFGCKSTKSLTSTGSVKENISAKQIIKENQKQKADFKTLQAKVKIDYTEGDKANGVSVNLRIEKDKVIWLSAPLGVARVMITPQKVSYYNKWENEYFDGDYTLLSALLGIDLDFEKVQNLLLGETLFNLKSDNYLASNNEASYILQPENQQALFEIFYLLNPGHFKLDSQQLSQPLKKRFLQIDYKMYQLVDKQIFPEIMNIVAVELNDEVKIDLEFKSMTINEEIRFPFDIPSGYKEIQIK
jgi:hypothetical protein